MKREFANFVTQLGWPTVTEGLFPLKQRTEFLPLPSNPSTTKLLFLLRPEASIIWFCALKCSNRIYQRFLPLVWEFHPSARGISCVFEFVCLSFVVVWGNFDLTCVIEKFESGCFKSCLKLFLSRSAAGNRCDSIMYRGWLRYREMPLAKLALFSISADLFAPHRFWGRRNQFLNIYLWFLLALTLLQLFSLFFFSLFSSWLFSPWHCPPSVPNDKFNGLSLIPCRLCHPNIVQLLETYEDKTKVYLIMELWV